MQKEDGSFEIYNRENQITYPVNFIDKKLIEYVLAFSDGLAVVQCNENDKTRRTFIKEDGTLAFGLNSYFYSAGSFHNGLAFVSNNQDDNFYYINTKGEKAFDKEFVEAEDFKNGIAWVKDEDDLYYCIDTNGDPAFDDKELKFDGYVEDFVDGVAKVYMDSEEIYIDRRGRRIF